MYKSGNQFENALRHLEFANEIREQIHSKEISQKIKALEIENKISTIRNVISNEIQQATLNSISQELHDNVCQILSLTKMQLNLIEQNLDKDQNILLHAKENLSKALTDLRDIAKGMSSDRIKLLGLYESVSQEVDRINKIDNIKVSLNIDGERVEPSNQTQLIIFRIIQECIQNIIKHANATNVNIHFFYREKSFEIVIKDDGIGFDVEKKYNSSDGMGLMNIFSRIKLVGGVVNLSSSPGSGTSVSISVPL
jgi:signal transduction histidine kinase